MRPSTGGIPKFGPRRQPCIDAITEAFAADAEYSIRRLVAEKGWDADEATVAYRVALVSIVEEAVDTGRSRLIQKAAAHAVLEGVT